MRPADQPPDWARTDLWNSAQQIPDVDVRIDYQGEMAARFGAQTSGHVVLYDDSGRLVFSGGITAARGHEGDNLGANTIVSLIKGDKSGNDQSPVFGCPLTSAEEMDTHAER